MSNDVFDEDLMRELGLDPEDIAAVKNPGATKKAVPAAPAPKTSTLPPMPAKPPMKAPSAGGIGEAPPTRAPKPQPRAPLPAASQSAAPEPAKDPEDLSSHGERMTQNIPVHLAAVLAKKSMPLKDVIEMRLGEVIDFKKLPQDPIDLVVNGKLVAKAELVMIDGRVGARIVKLIR